MPCPSLTRHPTLTGLKNLYDQGEIAILNSVGYSNPDRLHFRSMDIWQSASPADTYWLGRYLDAQCLPGIQYVTAGHTCPRF
ncbi:MAG: hypothetical protein LH618_02990 [Saprospiraceae bacterium]|nr:hypothetical protein [Saprospiraceae bacterium]